MSGIVSASGERGACKLMEIVGTSTCVGDIWSGLGSVGTNTDAGTGAVATGRNN